LQWQQDQQQADKSVSHGDIVLIHSWL
jgi:hypothetical protein